MGRILLQVAIFLCLILTSRGVTAHDIELHELWVKVRQEKNITVDALIDDFVNVAVVPRQWVYNNRNPEPGFGWDMETLDRGRSVKKWKSGTVIRVFGHTLDKERSFLEKVFPEIELLTGLHFVFENFECPETENCIEINFFGSNKDPSYRKYCLDCFDVGPRYPLGIYRLNSIASKLITKLYQGELEGAPQKYKFKSNIWNYFDQIATYFTQYNISDDPVVGVKHNVKGFITSTYKNDIFYSSCGIPADTIIQKIEVQTLVLECFVRSMGLLQISKIDSGVIGRWSTVRQFTPILNLSNYDRLMLRLLYDGDITPGMAEGDVRSALHKKLLNGDAL